MPYLWPAVACLVLLAAFIIAEYREDYAAGVVLKGLASACFVLLGVLGACGAADARFAGLIVAGLAAGAVADVLLNLRYVYAGQWTLFFTFGTIVFLAGHVLYSAGVWPRAQAPFVCAGLGASATVVIVRWIFSRLEAPGSLRALGALYMGVVAILSCLVLSALIARPSHQLLALSAGTLLFFVSDVIHILNTFGTDSRFKRRVVNLVLYYLGQILIALSLQLG